MYLVRAWPGRYRVTMQLSCHSLYMRLPNGIYQSSVRVSNRNPSHSPSSVLARKRNPSLQSCSS